VDFNLWFNFDFGDSCRKQSVLLLLTGSFFLLLCILFAERKYDSPDTDLIAVYSNFFLFFVCVKWNVGRLYGWRTICEGGVFKEMPQRVRNACVVFV
jgi:hypothetical protein